MAREIWMAHEQRETHHVQIDVKFPTLPREKGAPVRRYQYTAIDDTTRVRALKIYHRHTQANAIQREGRALAPNGQG